MIFTDVDAKWNPDTQAVEWEGYGGIGFARNTIKYIASQQYSKAYKSKTKESTPSDFVQQLGSTTTSVQFTRHQLNMFVEQYLEAVCQHNPDMWIPCAEENSGCFCPMGTVRYGSRDTNEWAPKKISNTLSYMPEGYPCTGHGKCPPSLPHKGRWREDGSYMCYRDQDYKNTICAGGYTFGPETGLCTAIWTTTKGEKYWRGKCDDAKGYWNPFVYTEGYKHHPYTCYMFNLACHNSAQNSGHPDVTECNCDSYAGDNTVPDFAANKNPHNKKIVSDTAFAFQFFVTAQGGGASSLKGTGSGALVECTNNQFGGDPAKTHANTCECKRTTCKDIATIRADFRKDYEHAVLNWKH